MAKQKINREALHTEEGLIELLKAFDTEIDAIRSLVNELRTDHATFKTQADAMETAVEELMDDHATFKTAADQSETAVEELMDDHATNIAVIADLKTAINALSAALITDGIINATTLSVGSTPENVASTAFQYMIDGVTYTKAAVAAGTAFTAADTINTGAAAGQYWGIWAIQITAGGTISTKSPAADQVYANEAAAIAALPAADAGNVVVGYVTVQSSTDVDWVAQTDDLTPASDCADSNFYSTASSIPAAVATSPAATLTASKPASAPATLTASKPASAPATLTAAAVTEQVESPK